MVEAKSAYGEVVSGILPDMWIAHREALQRQRGFLIRLSRDDQPLTRRDVCSLWQQDADFRSFFNQVLADSSFTAFRWETPPVSASSANLPFEFVVLESLELSRTADPRQFAEHWKDAAAEQSVVSFPNLGGDAILVVPTPVAAPAVYAHLATFGRAAPERQRHALWAEVGRVMECRIGQSPVWLSTAGAGVPWLHVRFDKVPKYFGYEPYRDSGA